MSSLIEKGRPRGNFFVVLCLIVLGLVNCTPASRSDAPTGKTKIWYAVYFSEPGNEKLKIIRRGPDAALVEAINLARISVDMAADNFDLWNVRDALIDAHRRGVVVRVVVESDNLDGAEIQDLAAAGIPVIGDASPGLMHDKFVVIDRMLTWTGSMNFTLKGAYESNNNLLQVRSTQLAQIYRSEFEEMFVDRLFGQSSPGFGSAPDLTIDGTRVEVYFSPEDDTAGRLMELIQDADESIFFLAYAFTDDDLAEALVEASARGVKIEGVMDESQARNNLGSDFDYFLKNGLNVRLDGQPGSMHHKVLIIDERTVVTGSYNFSKNARTRNDENSLIIHDQDLAEVYLREFQRILSDAQ